MAQPARQPEHVEDEIPVDPTAIERAYREARARRRARIRHSHEVRQAHVRFYLVMLVLLAGAVALVLGTWREIEKLFGL